jgi:hypothetical protein
LHEAGVCLHASQVRGSHFWGTDVGNAIGELLPLAIGMALSPLPIVAQILMLFGKRARNNGPAGAS